MLLLDDRIGSKELDNVINVPHALVHLDYADACFAGNGPNNVSWNIGIERKTITDLLNSITTGRLVGHQLQGLLDQFDVIYLVVEGAWRIGPKTGLIEIYRGKRWKAVGWNSQRFMGTAITSFLNSLAVMCNVHVWISQNKTQTGRWLSGIYKWWQKPWEAHKSLKHFHNVPAPVTKLCKPSRLQCVVKEFDGIGWEKAEDISKHFGTIIDFALTDEEELLKIQGIGKKLASKIVKDIRGGK